MSMKVSFVSLPTTIEPLGIMYLSAALKQAGHDANIGLDGDILAASIMPGSEEILSILEREKKGRKIVVGGPEPTYNPERYQLPFIDGVCRGDGEKAIVDFAEGKWTGTIRGEMTTQWPRPDRSIVYGSFIEHRYSPIRHFMLSRGCPYNCLTGDTIIHTLLGEKPIRDLVGLLGVKVLSRDPVTQKPVYANAINIGKRQENVQIVRVWFDDKSHIDCTPDHKFKVFKSKNQYIPETEWDVEAKDLKRSDRVRAVYCEKTKNGRKTIFTRRDIGIPNAQLVYEALQNAPLQKGEKIHHKDRNPGNDHPDNLVLTTNEKHIPDWHPEVSERMRANNPIRLLSHEWRVAHGISSFRGRKQSIEERVMRSNMQMGAKNSNYRGDTAVNHKVKSIEYLILKQDVYCMEIPGIHWFYANKVLVHNCAYCFNHSYRKLYEGENVLRNPDPGDAMAEIQDTMNTWGGRFVYFQDDTFNLKQPFLDAFLPLYREKVGLPFHCHLRAELVTEDQIRALKEAGCYSARFAIEIAGEKKQSLLNRGKITDEDCLNAARLLNKYGIKVMTQNILCLPDTTIEDDLATLDLNKRCHPTYAWASIYQPYRGTKLGDYCYEKGIVEQEAGRFFSGSPLNIPERKRREGLQKRFSLFASGEDAGEWIYSRHRAENERLLYGGFNHQSGGK